jgi:hypothetical protein
LTVHGLSYLRKLDQEIELRRAILAFAARIASILVGSFFGCSVFLCSPAVGIIGSTCVGIVEPFCMGAFSLGRWALLQIRHDSREAGSLHRGEEVVACLIAWFALGHDGFFKSAGENGARSARHCDDSTQPMVCPPTTSVCIKLTTFMAGWLPWPFGTTRRPGRFLLERRAFMLKARMPQLEYPMNIFYIIGVIVVVLFVAGFLGLHA